MLNKRASREGDNLVSAVFRDGIMIHEKQQSQASGLSYKQFLEQLVLLIQNSKATRQSLER